MTDIQYDVIGGSELNAQDHRE